MIYLLDTSVVSEIIRENSSVDNRLASLVPTDRIVVCTTVYGEISFGVRRLPAGKKQQELEVKAADVLSRFVCEPLVTEVGLIYADLKMMQQKRGFTLNDNDLWIAATSRFLEATLVSSDRDFLRIDGLIVEDWTK